MERIVISLTDEQLDERFRLLVVAVANELMLSLEHESLYYNESANIYTAIFVRTDLYGGNKRAVLPFSVTREALSQFSIQELVPTYRKIQILPSE